MKPTTEINYLTDLGRVIKAYEEIAASRMQNIRNEVVKNREFTGQLNRIFCTVKNSYQKELEKYKLMFLRQKNGKTARIFIAANTGLYGDMVYRIFNLFSEELKESPSDPIIVGRLGKTLFESTHRGQKFAYFEMPDKGMILAEIEKIVEYLAPYEKVFVYHGLFRNILMQEAVSTNISGDSLLAPEEKTPTRKLIFEPSIPQILHFFETEIFSGLLVHVIFESQLAKFSSRMAALEQATENIKKESLMVRTENTLLKRKISDKKQLEMMAGMSLWGN